MMDSSAFVDQAFQGYQASQQTAAGQSAGKAAKKMSLEQINEVAQDFEAFFVSKMMESMMSGIKTDGPFGGGQGEKVFRLRGMFQILPVPVHTRMRRVFSSQ